MPTPPLRVGETVGADERVMARYAVGSGDLMPLDKPLGSTPSFLNSSEVRIFVSHAAADEKFAAIVVMFLQFCLFPKATEIRCTSLPGFKLPAGAHSHQLLEEAGACDVFVYLVSPTSGARLFVSAELGARIPTRKHLAPVFVPGHNHRDLPDLLHGRQGFDLADGRGMLQVVREIARVLGVDPPSPEIGDLAVSALARLIKEGPSDEDLHRLRSENAKLQADLEGTRAALTQAGGRLWEAESKAKEMSRRAQASEKKLREIEAGQAAKDEPWLASVTS